MDVSLETPRFLLKTPKFSLETHIFSLDPRFTFKTTYFRLRPPLKTHIFSFETPNFYLGVFNETSMGVSNSTPMMMIFSQTRKTIVRFLFFSFVGFKFLIKYKHNWACLITRLNLFLVHDGAIFTLYTN